MRVCFVLRGRPGLGHVVPGAAIALAMAQRGHDVEVVTYGHGTPFLATVSDTLTVAQISVPEGYHDYPGLTIYDHGLRWLVPHLHQYPADLLILGGEYVLGMMSSLLSCPAAMIVNLEIFEDCPRNAEVAEFFHLAFRDIAGLVPLRPYKGGPIEPRLRMFLDRLAPPGPFRLQDVLSMDATPSHDGRVVLIATGGGMSFPQSTTSYSEGAVSSERWRAQTYETVITAVQTILRSCAPEDRVEVFGDLDPDTVLKRTGHDNRVRVQPPSADYYRVLASANLAVLRAGAGALADLESFASASVVWPLEGHDEQFQNAQHAAQAFGSHIACEPQDVAKAVQDAMASVEYAEPSPRLTKHSTADTPFEATCKYLENLSQVVA